MQVRLEGPHGTLASFDLDDDLGGYGGNLYIHVDDQEWGSLWFDTDTDDGLRIALGQYDIPTEGWEYRNPLTTPVDLTRAGMPAVNEGAYDPHGGDKHRFYEEN